MELAYFFDTYAFVEIIKNNTNYLNYIKGIDIVTTKLNLMELHYMLLRTCGKKDADKYYNLLLPYIIEVEDDIIKQANEFKLLHKKIKLSYIDCIGYIISKMNNIKFLTGDKEFKDMENVEFVK